jgi:hypothetical protein
MFSFFCPHKWYGNLCLIQRYTKRAIIPLRVEPMKRRQAGHERRVGVPMVQVVVASMY